MKSSFLKFTGILLAVMCSNAFGTVRYVNLYSTNAVSPFTDWSRAATNIQDAVDAAVDGDQIVVQSGAFQTGGRVVYGGMTNRLAITKAVTVQSVFGSYLTSIQGNPVVGTNAVRCVYLTNGATLVGFTLNSGGTESYTGDTDHEQSGGGAWSESYGCVISNCVISGCNANIFGGGVYGGTLYNCTLQNDTVVASGAGAAYSILINCTVMNNTSSGNSGGGVLSCTLSNCSLTGNSAYADGGGASGGTLNNCTVSGNTASYGGGASGGTLNNCVLTGNRAAWGGGADNAILNNCLITGNAAYIASSSGGANALGGGVAGGVANNCTIASNSVVSLPGSNGGGAYFATLNNCVIYANRGSSAAVYSNYCGGTINYCCTAPLPAGGAGNFSNAPLFVNVAGGNFHLQTNSPCINAGNNAYAPNGGDLDGHPRIAGGTVDVGAYEIQSPGSILSYAWAQRYGLPTDGTADFADTDGDGMNNWQEWRAGTNPRDASSVLQMLSLSNQASGLTVTWQSVSGVNYYVQRADDLTAQPPFTSLQSNLVGEAATASYVDTNAVGPGPYFYRVGVQ
ncbi:MAG TPA: choice-of-anchor Q domain-containing protein [Candidatus Acidoferrum sp.]|nr:choice-of-anchor Q domain-containing protein [Candidatus Acidoferrum sp.]